MNSIKKLFICFRYAPKKFKSRSEQFEKLFQRQTDPWNFQNSAWEKNRFNRVVEVAKMIRPKNLLEIGCAEGDLTKKLASFCPNVTAVEISPTAIAKAYQKAPGVCFINADANSLGNFFSQNEFDLTLATEILYYLTKVDAKKILSALKTKYLLTSNFWTASKPIGILIESAGYKLIKTERVFGFETFQLKISKISLWQKISN
ncbi:MAG: nodulation S family protein [Patescibacteria group bacterium]|nr:nodulation S family protein [Patescibacteria group bacterium]